MGRGALLACAFLSLGIGEALVFLLAPGRLPFHALPVLVWGGFFMAWAYRKLKDPGYYE